MNARKGGGHRRLQFESLEARCLLAAASFSEVSASLGLGGLLGGSGEYHAGGLTFTDLNRDGYADLYLIGPSSRGNRLYINVSDGDGGRTFVRAAGDGGTSYTAGNSTGSIAADYDNDGDLDIYLTNFNSSNILFKNMWMEDHPSGVGDPLSLRFVNVTSLTDPTPGTPPGDTQHGVGYATFENPDPLFSTKLLNNSMAAAWADVNRDGWVDLYVGSYDGTNGDPGESLDGRLGERDTLYLNNGDGTFTDVTMGPAGTALPTIHIDDGSFENAEHTTSLSNSNWVMYREGNTAQFQASSWASSDRATGVWFKGFAGSSAFPRDARVTQVVTAPASGDYTLRFDAKVEQNFPSVVGGFQASITSSGTGGSQSIDILAAAPDFNYNTYTLSLAGVSAGDQLTIVAEMIDSTGGSGPNLSGMVDAFFLSGPGQSTGWEQVGGWQFFDGTYNDPNLPAEFSGHNGLQFADFNNDGWQDLIVATMGGGGVGPNRDMLYLNRGVDPQGVWLGFHNVSYEIGFGGNESSDMGVAVADIDNDGDLDYFSTILPTNHPLWFNNLSDTGSLSFTYTELTNAYGWGANFHDFDNNGRVDLIVATDAARQTPSPTSYLHLQEWNGQFTEQGAAAGFTSAQHSIRSVAVADYNRDGWSDVAEWTIPSHVGPTPGIQLYRNNSAALNGDYHFLTLQLEGDPTLPGQFKSTRDAIGARAYVTADFNGNGTVEADETRMEEVLSGHSNASTTSSLALEFGLGRATTADVRIVWGSGRVTELSGVAADQFLSITEQATTLPGDFNGDGSVDLADYVLWRANQGTQQEYLNWKANFGNSLPAAGSGVSSQPASASSAVAAMQLVSAASPNSVEPLSAPSAAESIDTPVTPSVRDVALRDWTPQSFSLTSPRTKPISSYASLAVDVPIGGRSVDPLLLSLFLENRHPRPAGAAIVSDSPSSADDQSDQFAASVQEAEWNHLVASELVSFAHQGQPQSAR